MKLDEIARSASGAARVSVAHLEPPPLGEQVRSRRLVGSPIVRLATLVVLCVSAFGWWIVREVDSPTVTVTSDESAGELPRLGLVVPRWKVTTALEFPVPEALRQNLPDQLAEIAEGTVVFYEASDGSGTLVRLTVERVGLDEALARTDVAASVPVSTDIGGARGFSLDRAPEPGLADEKTVLWEPRSGVTARLDLTGFDLGGIDIIALAEAAVTLDAPTWAAIQEVTGWAQVVRSAAADYDSAPVGVTPGRLDDLMPSVDLMSLLAGTSGQASSTTDEVLRSIEAASTADWEEVAGHTYVAGSRSVEVLVMLFDAEEMATSQVETLQTALLPDPTAEADFTVVTSNGPLVVYVAARGWDRDPDARHVAMAFVAAVMAGG